MRKAIDAASELAQYPTESQDAMCRRLLSVIGKASVHPAHMKIELKVPELFQLLLPDAQAPHPSEKRTYSFEVPMQLRRRGVETKLIIGSPAGSSDTPDPKLIELISQCHGWLGDLVAGEVTSVREIAHRAHIAECDVSRFFPLAFLAPDIVEKILAGRQPVELTVERLKRAGTLPLTWEDQRRMLGLPANAHI